MKEINSTVSNIKESIFATITKEAIQNKAVNLGQGFPDFDGPKWVIDLAKDALDKGAEGKNQYAPSPGAPELRKSISTVYKNLYSLSYDSNTEVTVTNGATEAIFITALALINPGDEVIVFEPFYDSYVASIELAGGKVIPVTLKYPDFTFDIQDLEKAFSSKTKLVFFNSPHNPTGRVFSKEEVNPLVELIKKNDCYVVSDEVYEFLTFDGIKHVPLASYPGMKERTITISSTGKTFGLTGWKIGWACASPEVSHAIRMVHQFNTFSVGHPLQLAMAKALEKIESYIPEFQKLYSDKRDLFLKGLRDAGYSPTSPEGTYFSICKIEEEGMNDVDYCTKLIREKKVATIPPSAFYLNSNDGEKYVRFCFAKKDETLRAAISNLSK